MSSPTPPHKVPGQVAGGPKPIVYGRMVINSKVRNGLPPLPASLCAETCHSNVRTCS